MISGTMDQLNEPVIFLQSQATARPEMYVRCLFVVHLGLVITGDIILSTNIQLLLC